METLDPHEVGRLVQFSLNPKAHPLLDAEYKRLIARAEDDREFYAMFRDILFGMGLEIAYLKRMEGVYLLPTDESFFQVTKGEYGQMHPSTLRHAKYRLLGGLVQLAIGALMFPRPEDFDEDVWQVRGPITVADIEESLRSMCEDLEAKLQGQPDPKAGTVEGELLEAWQVYHNHFSDRDTPSGQTARGGTISVIKNELKILVKTGLFKEDPKTEEFYALPRYNIQIGEGAPRSMLEFITEPSETAPQAVEG
jgi:hypothetical protein